MATASTNVISWEDALQQCGDDEEFLRELLADFRSELETQLTSIAATIQVRSCVLKKKKKVGEMIYCD